MQPRELVPLVLNPPLRPTVIRDVAGLSRLKHFLDSAQVVGWDIETTPLKDFYYRRIRTIQFGNQEEQYLIDLKAFEENLYGLQGQYGKDLNLNLSGLSQVMDTIRPVLTDRNVIKVGVNLSFEYMMFYWCFGMRTQGFFDCALVEKVIYAGLHSLKDYSYYSMAAMMGRYFGYEIEKELQESFNLEDELTPEQVHYACLDVRLPFAIKKVQDKIITGTPFAELPGGLEGIDPIILGDNLTKTVQLENDAIGAFVDMHVHGERIDTKKWLARVSKKKQELADLIANRLDPVFMPMVGSKYDLATEEEVAQAHARWKHFDKVTPAELELKAHIAEHRRSNPSLAAGFYHALDLHVKTRKREKQKYKEIWNEMSKRRTKIRNLAADCEGEALVNYNSPQQLLRLLNDMDVVRHALGWDKKHREYNILTSLDDEFLEPITSVPVIRALRDKSKLAKEISTYGEAWGTEWVTHPCNAEGWLHPGDHRLHSTFNQLDAETGRSSSEQPNGQNVPRLKDIRSCFIVDPPDESIRVSNCCNGDTVIIGSDFPAIGFNWRCTICQSDLGWSDTHAEEYVMITADMSGAELRILAELSNETIWIDAFNKKQDVHCICCEMMDPEWPEMAKPSCAFYALNPDGTLQKKKCACPEHDEVRTDMKATNFGIPYGIGAPGLAVQIKKPKEFAQGLLGKHQQEFPILWLYLDKSGKQAVQDMKSFDMFGRRRLFPEPEWQRAKELAMEYNEERLRYDEETQARNLEVFIKLHDRKPTPEEAWSLNHRMPYDQQIKRAFISLHTNIERQGKNHPIQGTNASIAKVAMGAGYDRNGKPYLWHTLGQYKAKLLKFVHDELVVHCPARMGNAVAALIGDAFKRAGAEVLERVEMEFEYKKAPYWTK